MTKIPNTNEIKMFIHCGMCLKEEIPEGESPQSRQRIEAGWTELGLQIWCNRHDVNIVHINFEGKEHPANTNMVKKKPGIRIVTEKGG